MGTRIRQYNLKDLVAFLASKHVAVPEFQRGFVWKTGQVKKLFDSLVNQYPVGSFILWETNKSIDARALDGEKLPRHKYLILDGQQRLASIFYLCRQKKFVEPHVKDKFHEASDSRARDVIDFEKFYIGRSENGPVLEYGRDSSSKLDFPRFQRLVSKTYRFPIIVISLDDYRKAIEVFERINQAGTRISTESIFLSETWNRHSHISQILRTWKRKNKKSLTSGIDTVIFIHVFGIILQLQDKQKGGTIEIGVKTLKRLADRVKQEKGETYNRIFQSVVDAIARAVNYLKAEYGITSLGALPSQTMITVLSVFFYYQRKSQTTVQLRELRRWFWRSSLANRYIGSGYSQNIDRDVKKMRALAESSSRLNIPVVKQMFAKLREVDLRTGRSTYRNIIKQALWQQKPVFINGTVVGRSDVESGQHKPDDDHFFPYNLSQKGVIGSEINNIFNLHFLSHAENIRKWRHLPSVWLQQRVDEIKPKQSDIKKYFDSQLLPFGSVRDLKRYEKAFRLKGKARERVFAQAYSRFLKRRFRLFERTLFRLQNGAVQ